jgi:hypothetical protein
MQCAALSTGRCTRRSNSHLHANWSLRPSPLLRMAEASSIRNTYRGLQVVPGGGRQWDWRETHTEHVPGIQPADVQELLDRGSKVVVLSRGMQLMLRTCPETLQLLKDNGVGVYVEETRKATELYNKLAGREPVGGLFHSTC